MVKQPFLSRLYRFWLCCHCPSANPAFICQVAAAPAGTQAAQIDIKSAYRCIPTRFEHLPHLVVGITKSRLEDTEIFIDRCHPFGLRSSGGNLGLALDATIDILTCILAVWFWAKWVDDIVPIRRCRADGSYDVHLDKIVEWLEYLGWPLSREKLRDFASVVRYIGFDWDFDCKLVSLPEEKRVKFLSRVSSWIHDASHCGVTIEQTEQLLGTLSHISNVHQIGRSFLPATQSFLAAFYSIAKRLRERAARFVRIRPSAAAISDITVWRDLLTIPSASRSLRLNPLIDPDVWVDASSDWGVAIVVEGRWRAWKLLPGWNTDGRDIGWAESVALEFAVHHLVQSGFSHVRLLIHSDSQGTIGQYNKGRGKNRSTNDCIRRSVASMLQAHIDITPEYVRSEDNTADGPSRGRGLDSSLKLTHAFDVPEAVKHLLTDV
jgi:hypothetical protein